MNYVISNLCLANKIHMRILLMGFIMASHEKIWFENTRVSQFKTTQPCFHIGLGSRGVEPPRYFQWGAGVSLSPPSPPQKILYPYKFRLKRAWNYAYLPNTKFSQAREPLQPPKSYTYVWLLTEKRLKLWIYGSPKYTFSYEKEGAPLWPPKITYFCNYRKKCLKIWHI